MLEDAEKPVSDLEDKSLSVDEEKLATGTDCWRLALGWGVCAGWLLSFPPMGTLGLLSVVFAVIERESELTADAGTSEAASSGFSNLVTCLEGKLLVFPEELVPNESGRALSLLCLLNCATPL